MPVSISALPGQFAKVALPLLCAGVLLAGCESTGDKRHRDSSIGVPNPASARCQQEGGHATVHKDRDGNWVRICHLPSGEAIEEWELLRKRHREATEGA